MKITAYIPCHNGEAFLPEVLPALRTQSRPADQYLLVNDRSTDRTVELARQFGFEVFHTGPEHVGLAAGRNVALQHAQGDLLVGIDADAVAEPDFLEQVEQQFLKHPELVGLCGCLREKYATASIADMWRSIHMRQHFGPAEVNNPPILFGSSSCHRTAALRQVGGWNHQFKTNYEDVDLTQRLQAAGGRTLYSPACRLWHLRRDSVESVLKGWWSWNFPPGELAGAFQSISSWVRLRLPWIWSDYRRRRLHDQTQPQLAVITCLLPWSTIQRDLHEVFGRMGVAFDLKMVGVIARDVFVQSGTTVEHATWLGRWLQDMAVTLPAHPGIPTGTANAAWDKSLIEGIRLLAVSSVPDASYWSRIESSFRRADEGKGSPAS